MTSPEQIMDLVPEFEPTPLNDKNTEKESKKKQITKDDEEEKWSYDDVPFMTYEELLESLENTNKGE